MLVILTVNILLSLLLCQSLYSPFCGVGYPACQQPSSSCVVSLCTFQEPGLIIVLIVAVISQQVTIHNHCLDCPNKVFHCFSDIRMLSSSCCPMDVIQTDTRAAHLSILQPSWGRTAYYSCCWILEPRWVCRCGSGVPVVREGPAAKTGSCVYKHLWLRFMVATW